MAGRPVQRGKPGPLARSFARREAQPFQPGNADAFQPGNTAALKHGAFSASVDGVALELVEAARTLVPYLSEDPSYTPALNAWARSEVRIARLSAWLDEHGLVDEKGNPRPALAALQREDSAAANHRARLGLDPSSRARLLASLASASVGRDLASRLVALDAEEVSA